MDNTNPIYIKQANFTGFSQFKELKIDFSRHINVISGETGVGKTHLMKALYSIGKSYNEQHSTPNVSPTDKLANKLTGVFQADSISNLINKEHQKATIDMMMDDFTTISCSFSKNSRDGISITHSINPMDIPAFTYVPIKEIISASTTFARLYEEYDLPFEETYLDLSILLAKEYEVVNSNTTPLFKMIEDVIEGKPIIKNDKYYLLTNDGNEITMGLVAEGFRKLATLMRLLENGSLSSRTILFWDEPEANLNPKMIPFVKTILLSLAKMGVQIFITTHSYFFQQELSLFCEYENCENLDIQFITLFKNHKTGILEHETQDTATELEHNPIQEEFEQLINKENDLFYD
ncbi:AAA family ATPase [Bacillus sp. FJAT-45350]|uniref:AAA family ATPase n=1 Tax=Bacillus sp. FJAT-45350 TaxID=2011014 RepID=UPI000BB85439|nr:AAA family ATPase [Bacillus sp. FJAT-45350]